MASLATLFHLPDTTLQIEEVQFRDDHCTVQLRTTAPSAACPVCTHPSATVHSRYRRAIRDVPCAGHAVCLCVEVRRFRCHNRACPRQIFAERLPDLAPTFAQRTARLTATLQRLALTLASKSGAPLLARCGMPVSPSTLLRVQRQLPLPVPPPPNVIGIDEFAFRKGHTYGTLIVDLERRVPIAVLPDNQAATVAAWLAQQPQLTTITRDRAGAFAEAATAGAPQATQVADRWHLAKNVGEALQRLLQRHPAALRQAAQARAVGTPATAVPSPDGNVAMATTAPTGEGVREQRFREVLALHAQGWSLWRIARALRLNWRTVRRYVQARELPKRGGPVLQATSTVTPHLPYLRERLRAGRVSGAQLWRELQARGYAGSLASVYRALKHLRPTGADPDCQLTSPPASRRALSPRQAMWLLVRDEATLTPEQVAARAVLLGAHPALAIAAGLATRFITMLRERAAAALDTWLADAADSSCGEFRRFAASLRKDAEAVRGAFSSPWSNGQLEGQINRVKVIKRVVYGRAKFDLLARRILCRA
jgi:transposase